MWGVLQRRPALLVYCAVVSQDGEQLMDTGELGGQNFTAFDAALGMLFILSDDYCCDVHFLQTFLLCQIFVVLFVLLAFPPHLLPPLLFSKRDRNLFGRHIPVHVPQIAHWFALLGVLVPIVLLLGFRIQDCRVGSARGIRSGHRQHPAEART